MRVDPLTRFVQENPSKCWPWLGSESGGYGRLGRKWAHRVVWEALMGAIPEGLTLDHLCRNTICVNPNHLEPVSRRENTLRGFGPAALKARQTHCVNGHAFTPENTYYRPDTGTRMCRECNRLRCKERYARRVRVIPRGATTEQDAAS